MTLHDGRSAIQEDGFSYLPRFVTQQEHVQLVDYFGSLRPLWEKRDANTGRSLTRPVYWLGAWQFACLGYYAEPDYRQDRCLRGEPLHPVLVQILDRLRTLLLHHNPKVTTLPNTCLINYYGRKVGEGPPVDCARLKMHRDAEPGPVVMISLGQAGLLEFVDPERSETPELSVWTRDRSACILSGPDFKDRLYHRISDVRRGLLPKVVGQVHNFETRRISVSFRHVPNDLIHELSEMSPTAQSRVRDYVENLAAHSPHYRAQLALLSGEE